MDTPKDVIEKEEKEERTPEIQEKIRKASAYIMERNKEVYKRLAER